MSRTLWSSASRETSSRGSPCDCLTSMSGTPNVDGGPTSVWGGCSIPVFFGDEIRSTKLEIRNTFKLQIGGNDRNVERSVRSAYGVLQSSLRLPRADRI